MVISGIMEAWVWTKRIQAFLELGELDLDQYCANMRGTTAATTNSNTAVTSDNDHANHAVAMVTDLVEIKYKMESPRQNGTDMEVHVNNAQGGGTWYY